MKLGILLIAIEEEPLGCRRGKVQVNPGFQNKIKPKTIGIFIGNSADEVSR